VKRIGIGLLCCLSLVWSSDKRLITIQTLVSFPSIREVQLAPDGKWIIYTLRTTDFESNRYRRHLWKVDTQEGHPQQFTYSSGNEWHPRISPDGRYVAFFSDREDETSKKQTRVWILPANGGEARPLSLPDKDWEDFQWLPTSRGLILLGSEKAPPAVKQWQEEHKAEGLDAQVHTRPYPKRIFYRLELPADKGQLIYRGDPGIQEFQISPTGQGLVYVTNYTGDPNDWVEEDLFYLEFGNNPQPRRLTSFPGAESHPRCSPDGKWIAYLALNSPQKPFSQTEIDLISLTGKGHRRLTATFDRTIGDFWWPTSDTIYFTAALGLTNHLFATDLSGKTQALTAGAAYFHRFAFNRWGRQAAAVKETAVTLGEIVFFHHWGRPPHVLTNFSDSLRSYQLARQEIISWPSRDGRFRIEGLLVHPAQKPARPGPLLLWIHGGPAGRVDIALQQWGNFQAFAAEGFTILAPNYRGSEGYSANFQVANYRDLGGGDYQDIMAGVAEVIRQRLVAPESLVVMGGSYGGYMTNWIISHTQRFKAAVSAYGIFSLMTDFSNSDYAQWELDYLGVTYWQRPDLYRRMSPASFVDQIKTPTLIIHGSDDNNTFPSNSRELYRALKTLGTPVAFVEYPREGHGISEPGHRVDLFYRELDWFNRWLKRGTPAHYGEWVGRDWRFRVLDLQSGVKFLNRGDSLFTVISFVLDGRDSHRPLALQAQDIYLTRGQRRVKPEGVPSGELLGKIDSDPIQLQAGESSTALKVAFPGEFVPGAVFGIEGLGRSRLLPWR